LSHKGREGRLAKAEQQPSVEINIAWAVASLLQFGPDSSQIKAAAGFLAVDQEQVVFCWPAEQASLP
jgi:hypothetical protein